MKRMNSSSKAFLLLCVVHFSRAGVWLYIGHGCIGAKGNTYKELVYNGPTSFVGSVKLVHASGYVANNVGNSGSYWGSNGNNHALATLVTDDQDRILYPSRVTKVGSASKGWYGLPGYTGQSPELIFSDFCAPQYFKKGKKVRLWYGEDLFSFTESDNHGKSCMNVYFYLLGR